MLDANLPEQFANPPIDAQSGFRAIMHAMARPGEIVEAPMPLSAPGLLNPVAAMVAMTLCDYDTPIWLDPVLAESPDLKAWVAFHTGAPLVGERISAAFAFVSSSRRLGELSQYAQGTDVYPDRSTTLVVQSEALTNATGVTLAGPGIETRTTFGVAPLPENFWDCARANHALYPRGVDLIFCTRTELACLPRSTRFVERG